MGYSYEGLILVQTTFWVCAVAHEIEIRGFRLYMYVSFTVSRYYIT